MSFAFYILPSWNTLYFAIVEERKIDVQQKITNLQSNEHDLRKMELLQMHTPLLLLSQVLQNVFASMYLM